MGLVPKYLHKRYLSRKSCHIRTSVFSVKGALFSKFGISIGNLNGAGAKVFTQTLSILEIVSYFKHPLPLISLDR